MKTYWLWKEGPWDLPTQMKAKTSSASQPSQSPNKAVAPLVGTEVIIAKNLFDPERGASKTKEAEADTRSMQRIRNMVLLGTAILGGNRYAIVQDSDGGPPNVPGAPGRSQPARRLKVGDMVEGFNLSEINEKGIVFIKGASRVEVPVDFFRKIDVPARPPLPGQPVPVQPAPVQPGQVGTPAPPPPTAVPNITRRPRLPAAPGP